MKDDVLQKADESTLVYPCPTDDDLMAIFIAVQKAFLAEGVEGHAEAFFDIPSFPYSSMLPEFDTWKARYCPALDILEVWQIEALGLQDVAIPMLFGEVGWDADQLSVLLGDIAAMYPSWRVMSVFAHDAETPNCADCTLFVVRGKHVEIELSILSDFYGPTKEKRLQVSRRRMTKTIAKLMKQ